MSFDESDSRPTGTLLTSIGTSPSAATASLCRTMPVPASTSAISSIGWIRADLVARPAHETRMVSSVMRARSFFADTRPYRSIGRRVTRKPFFSRYLAMLRIEMCSASVMMTWSPLRLLRWA